MARKVLPGLLDLLAADSFSRNKKNGFWDGCPQEMREKGITHPNCIYFVATKIGLIATEVSEAMEAHRVGNPADDKIPEFSGLEAEFADVIERILDVAGAFGLRIGEALIAKQEMNTTRDFRHGGKLY